MNAYTKGISPLVASVLLIVIVVTIAALLISWITTFTKGAQQTVTNRTDVVLDCSGAAISIQDVYMTNGSAGTIRVLVKNDGLVRGLSIISGQAINRTGGNFTATGVPITNFDIGDVENVVFANVSMATCDAFSQVIVTTNCGGIYDTYTRSPKCV
jgi:flagellin-like protein